MKNLPKIAVLLMSYLAGTACGDVLYQQTFSLPANTKSVKLDDYGWSAYLRGAADAETWEMTADTKRAVVSPSADQVSKDSNNVKAAAPAEAKTPGRGYVQGAGKGAILLLSKAASEFKLDPADFKKLTFSIRLRNETRKNNVPVRLVVKLGEKWYVSNSFASSNAGGWKLTPDDAANGYDTYEFTFSTTAANWRVLDYKEDGAEPKVVNTSLKDDLPKEAITQFGYFFQANAAAHRFDDIKVEGDKGTGTVFDDPK